MLSDTCLLYLIIYTWPAKYLRNSQIFVEPGQIFTENDKLTASLHIQIRILRVALNKPFAGANFIAH